MNDPSSRIPTEEQASRYATHLPQPHANVGAAEAVPFSRIELERPDWLVEGRVPFGAVTLLAGVPGVGKSLYTIALAAHVSNSVGSVLLLTAEDSLSSTVKPRLLAAGADTDCVKTVHLRRHGVTDGLAIPDDVPELSRLAQQHDARLVVIDPLMAHLPNPVNSWRDQSVRRALAPLHQPAETRSCAVVVVVHLNKALSTDPLLRIGGSIGITAAARSVLLFGRDPHDPEHEGGRQRVLAHIKCNLGPIQTSLLYDVTPALIQTTDSGPDIDTAKLELVGESQHTGAELLNQPNPDERSAIEEAADFLRDQLADGDWHSSTAVKDAAKADRHSPATLRRAREQLRVEVERQGFPARTMWRLSDEVQSSASRVLADESDRETGTREHESTNPHEQADLRRAGPSSTPSRAHHQPMSTTGRTREAATDDQRPYPGGEAGLLTDLINAFDAEERAA